MSEGCPLVELSLLHSDLQGYVWDTGIPDQCLSCLRLAEADPRTRVLEEEIDISGYAHNGIDMASDENDKWHSQGLRNNGDSSRSAKIETGFETPATDSGDYPDFRIQLDFECYKND